MYLQSQKILLSFSVLAYTCQLRRDLSNFRYAFAYTDSVMVCIFIMILILNVLKKRIFN